MIEFNHTRNSGLTRISSQPIALTAAVLVALVAGAGSIALWRGYTGNSPEPDRVVVPLNERPYGIYDGFDRLCGQSSANYRGQDGRRYPCN